MSSAAYKVEDLGIESFADELKAGTKLLSGQFEILSFLNAGGFGITYVAKDSLHRRVVVKECFPSAICRRTDNLVTVRSRQRQDEFRSIVAMFVQEALNLAKLNHPNIVKVHQVFQDNETAYMAMDLIDGPDLLETVEGTAPRLTPDQIIAALSKMLDALGYVHAQGFLHRDVSPDNILLDRTTGEPVLIDFGASRKDVNRKSRAVSGLRMVKDGYSPQEFYISGSKQAPCSDLYALAATFCHLISGEAPRTSQERLSAIANRDRDPQIPLVGRVKGYPEAFLAAIDKAMLIFPKDRLQSVAEWRAMLGGTAEAVAAPVTVASAPAATAPFVAAAPAAPAFSAADAALGAPTVVSRQLIEENAPARVATTPVTMVVPEVMRPQRALLRAILVPAIAALLLFAGILAAPGDLWQRGVPSPEGPVIAIQDDASPAVDTAAPPAVENIDAPFALKQVVQLPFAGDPQDLARVMSRLPWSPEWIQPGQRIVEVNGVPVQDGSSIPDLMASGLDLANLPSVNVIFGYEEQPGGTIINKMASLPVVGQIQLENGLIFDVDSAEGGIRTVVANVPEAAAIGGLRTGDILVAYAATGETLSTKTALQDILMRGSANGVATYAFAIQRADGVAIGSFTLPGMN